MLLGEGHAGCGDGDGREHGVDLPTRGNASGLITVTVAVTAFGTRDEESRSQFLKG